MKEKKKLIILIVTLLLIVVIGFVAKRIKYTQMTNSESINQIENNTSSNLPDEEKLNSTIKDGLENKTQKEALSVNGEKITEGEIALYDFQLNNKEVNDEELRDATNELIKEYVICQDAQQLNITLTDKEMQDIKDVVKYDDNTAALLNELNMSYDEFCEMYISRRSKLDLKTKWTTYIMEKINEGEINIDSELFNKKYKEYKETDDISVGAKLLLELVDIYADYLVSKATIEEIG